MVRKSRARRIIGLLFVLLLVLCLILLLVGMAPAQDEEEEEPTMEEMKKITLNKLGDGKVESTITYPEDLYNRIKDIVDERPDYLTRRYASGEK